MNANRLGNLNYSPWHVLPPSQKVSTNGSFINKILILWMTPFATCEKLFSQRLLPDMLLILIEKLLQIYIKNLEPIGNIY